MALPENRDLMLDLLRASRAGAKAQLAGEGLVLQQLTEYVLVVEDRTMVLSRPSLHNLTLLPVLGHEPSGKTLSWRSRSGAVAAARAWNKMRNLDEQAAVHVATWREVMEACITVCDRMLTKFGGEVEA